MKSSKHLVRVGFLAALGASACGDVSAVGPAEASGGNGGGSQAAPPASTLSPTGAAGATSPSPGSEQTNVAGLQPSGNMSSGSAGASAGGLAGSSGTGTTTCEPSACAPIDVDADGAANPGCCTMVGSCGGLLEFMGMSFCAPTNAAPPLTPEPIVTDPRCLPQTFPNPAGGGTLTLAGCCDASGICGVSTAGVTATDAGAGILTACLTPTDLAGFGGGADAGAEVACR